MLNICRKTFDKFNKDRVLYCHWKSNEHLEAGLDGKTDLDILIDRKNFSKANKILLDLGYKRCNTVDYLDYYSVEDFIGFDERAGKMVHLHLHYELVLGRKFIKEYHLPLEDEILNNRILEKENDVYIIDPNYELLLLLIRRAFKQNRLNFRQDIFPDDEKKEFSWLLDRIDLKKIGSIAERLIDEEFSALIIDFISNRAGNSFKKIKRIVLDKFKSYCLYSSFFKLIKYGINKSRAAYNYLNHKYLNRPVLYRRGIQEGGFVIAFTGVDGAGKSTMIEEISRWISWKIDVQQIYFGSGGGRSSLLRLPLKLIAGLRTKLKGDVVANSKKNDNKKKKNIIFRIMKVLWAITLAVEKKKKIKKTWRARTRGMVVLCDRYPQTQFYGFNDGPLLRDWANSSNFLKRKISNWEYNIYDLANQITPDLVFKLIIPAEVAVERKRDTPLYMIEEKIDVINSLKFNQNTEVNVVSTDTGVVDTSLKIKRIIWSALDE